MTKTHQEPRKKAKNAIDSAVTKRKRVVLTFIQREEIITKLKNGYSIIDTLAEIWLTTTQETLVNAWNNLKNPSSETTSIEQNLREDLPMNSFYSRQEVNSW